jgi:hypothetical protein
MGTVTVGLLLAIALEQSVEAWHHHQEITELRHGLHEDAENAIEQTLRLDDLESQQISRFTIMANGIRVASVHHQPVAPFPPVSHGDYDLPDNPAWTAGLTGGIVTLLPASELKADAEVAATLNNVRESWRARNEVDRRLNAALAQFHTDFNNPAPPDFSTATPDELRSLALVFYEDVAARKRLVRMARELRGAESAVQSGERSLPRILAAERTFLK